MGGVTMINFATGGVLLGAAVLVVVMLVEDAALLALALTAATMACICGGSVSGGSVVVSEGRGCLLVVTIVNCCRSRGCASGVLISPRNLDEDAEDETDPRVAAAALCITSDPPSRRIARRVVVVYCLMTMLIIDEIECCG